MLSVGAVPPGQSTIAGHVAVLLPVASCFIFISILHGPVGAVNVKVSLSAPKVKWNLLPSCQLIVVAPSPVADRDVKTAPFEKVVTPPTASAAYYLGKLADDGRNVEMCYVQQRVGG